MTVQARVPVIAVLSAIVSTSVMAVRSAEAQPASPSSPPGDYPPASAAANDPGATAGAGRAASSGPTAPATASPDRLSPNPIIDSKVGYSIRTPRGWTVAVERTDPRTLVQAVGAQPQDCPPELLLRFQPLPPGAAPRQVLNDIEARTARQFQDLRASDRADAPVAGRPAARVMLRFTQGGRGMCTLAAAILARTRGCFVLTLTGASDQAGELAGLFDDVLGQFRLLGDDAEDRLVRGAAERGSAWMASLQDGRWRARAQPPTHLRIVTDGRDAGYLSITESPMTLMDADGLHLAEEGWTFAPNGDAQRFHGNLFLSEDAQVEAWERRVVALTPARDGKPASLSLVWEEGLRDHDALTTAQSQQFGQTPTNNPYLRLPESYVPRLLLRWLPRLVDLEQPATYAFSTFDHASASLALRLVDVKGRIEPPPHGLAAPVFAVEDREGLKGPRTEMWFDAGGRLLRLASGQTVMTPTDAAAIESRWRRSIDEAEAQMRGLESEYEKSVSRFAGQP